MPVCAVVLPKNYIALDSIHIFSKYSAKETCLGRLHAILINRNSCFAVN